MAPHHPPLQPSATPPETALLLTAGLSTPTAPTSTSLVDHELLQEAAEAILEPVPDHGVSVEYRGTWVTVSPGDSLDVGRDADVRLDNNPFLHRRLLHVSSRDGLWFLSNVGTRMTMHVIDGSGRVQARLQPGGRVPIVFERTTVVFSAGETSYEVRIHAASPVYLDALGGGQPSQPASRESVPIALTHAQRLLLLALCESVLQGGSAGRGDIPTSAKAAERLGWTVTAFNRKLDNVCEKLDRVGVEGLRGGARSYATNRRARLVDHAVRHHLVTQDDLYLLDVEVDSAIDGRTLPGAR